MYFLFFKELVIYSSYSSISPVAEFVVVVSAARREKIVVVVVDDDDDDDDARAELKKFKKIVMPLTW